MMYNEPIMITLLQPKKKGILWLWGDALVPGHCRGSAALSIKWIQFVRRPPTSAPLEFYFMVSRAGYGLLGCSLGKILSDDYLC